MGEVCQFLLSKSFFFSLSFGIVKLSFFVFDLFIYLLILWGHSWRGRTCSIFSPNMKGRAPHTGRALGSWHILVFRLEPWDAFRSHKWNWNRLSRRGRYDLENSIEGQAENGLCLKSAMKFSCGWWEIERNGYMQRLYNNHMDTCDSADS